MELTTLFIAFVIALGLVGTDTVIHSGSLVVEVTAAPKMDGEAIDQATLESEFDDQLFQIQQTVSLVTPQEIRTSHDQGLGMALARAVDAENVAYALQTEAGYAPDRLRLALFLEHGELRGQISAVTRHTGSFRQIIVPYKDEPLLTFVRRCALWSGSQLAPYVTALYLLQKHSSDRDFTDVDALIDHTMAVLPPTPISFDRSILENLRGIIELFKNQPAAAHDAFDRALEAYPDNAVAALNAAFADLQLDKDGEAAEHMQQLISEHPPANKVVLATAYMTWGAAAMGLHDLVAADRLLARSTEVNPDNSSSFELRAELEELRGNHEAAAGYRRQALLNTTTLENYGEVAALYFHLSWRNNEPVTLNKFTNPTIVSFH
jgi:predicted Zn-dependent protease